jgi:transcriptional regulator of met regulon
VLETTFTHYRNTEQQDIMLTEKTYKAIVSKKPFMMIAPSGSLELLKKEGFRTFESFVDESYDKTDDMVKKKTLIINQIKMLNTLTDAEFFRKLDELDKTVNYNLRRFLNLGKLSAIEHKKLFQDLDLVRK